MQAMDRLDLELYADRLAQHAERIADDIAAARLRLSWSAFEAQARTRLAAADGRVLEAIGVLGPLPGTAEEDRRLVERRRGQLEALARLQVLAEEQLGELSAERGGARG
jgi:hypothetical protein